LAAIVLLLLLLLHQFNSPRLIYRVWSQLRVYLRPHVLMMQVCMQMAVMAVMAGLLVQRIPPKRIVEMLREQWKAVMLTRAYQRRLPDRVGCSDAGLFTNIM